MIWNRMRYLDGHGLRVVRERLDCDLDRIWINMGL